MEEQTPFSAEKIAPTETVVEAVASTPEHGTVCNPANELNDGVPLESNRKLRPRRKAASPVIYPISGMDDMDGESTDEYTPNSDKN